MAGDMTIADLFICKRLGNATKLVSGLKSTRRTRQLIESASKLITIKAYSSMNGRPTEYSNYSGILPKSVETSLWDAANSTLGFFCSFTMTTNHTKMDNGNSSTTFIYNKTSRYHAIEAYGHLTTWVTWKIGIIYKNLLGSYFSRRNCCGERCH